MDYDGGRTRSDIVSRALDLFSENAPPPELLEVNHFLHSRQEALVQSDGGGSASVMTLILSFQMSSFPSLLKRSLGSDTVLPSGEDLSDKLLRFHNF